MMHVKVKAKDVRFTIPIPYSILNIVISIFSSKIFHQNINRWTKEHFERKKLDFTLPLIERKYIKAYRKGIEKI